MENAQTHRCRQISSVMLLTSILAAVSALSGCGVKSAPSHPEGATYPLVYPAPGNYTQPVPASTSTSTGRADTPARPARQQPDAPYYNPPPPATEILAK